MRRRSFLGLGAGGLLLPACANTPVAPPGSTDLEEVVGWIQSSSPSEVITRAGEALAGGLPLASLHAASMLVAARNLPLRPLGFDLHPLFTLHPVHLGAGALPWDRQLLPYLWGLWRVRRSMDDAASSAAPRLPPLDEATVPDAASALAWFRDAMTAGDEVAAMAGVAGMVRGLAPGAVREELWTWVSRDLLPIGHHAIIGAQVLRTLDVVGWRYAEEPLRAMVYAMLESAPDAPTIAPYAENLARADALGDAWEGGAEDDAAASALADEIGAADAAGAAQAVVDALAGGLAPSSVRDALLLAATDQMLRYADDDGLFPGLHAVTNCNAFGVIHRESGVARTRLVALLQNASFLPLNRAEAEARGGSDVGETVRGLTPAPAASLDEIFETMAGDRPGAAAQVLGWLAAGGEAADLVARLVGTAAVRAREEHDWKYPVAVIEEMAAVGDAWLPTLCAASVLHGRTAKDPDWEQYANALAAAEVALGG